MLRFGVPVSLSFAIPGADKETEMVGRVAWNNKDGQHGIKFADLSVPLRTTLQRWLWSEMKKDGWEMEPAP